MPIVQIAPATRQGMKLLISLFGLSETGKTYSALKLAAGIEPDPRKRGLLDTEGGERGRAYVDVIEGGYMYGSLTAPFTPERYMEALQDFVAAGVTTLVVDSVSHAWFAEGGILDMVENATEKNDMAKWAKPKRRLGKLTRQWLGCGLHLILCSRAKQPMIEENIDGKKKYVVGPVVPIQEKSLRYDMTIMAMMLGDGEFTVDKQWGGKCPGSLRPIFAAGTKMDEAMGKRLIDWIGGQDAASSHQRALALKADEVAQYGTDQFRNFWKALKQDERDFLKPKLDNYQSVAKAADDEATRLAAGERENSQSGDASDPFGNGPALQGGVVHTSEAA
ncbi:AAA family ATPase [Acidisoma cellulosilytica]|uniref:AAA family ATPase n=1 Tax=Acidisoma cellulosilyticum TaxID=2802395 RepID=A0A963YZL2_9PROT|nr:AAA family ATPase [Acidisoma cellulosilyticum]MCB8880078.1 AAA family ATPase [Acidisoma cellulosilyticum]